MDLGQKVYFHLNHPIRFVQLVGVVTSIDSIHDKLGIVVIDDGSGATLNIKINRRSLQETESMEYSSNTEVDNVSVQASIGSYAVFVDETEIEVGTVLRVKGLISTFRDVRQLELQRVQIVESTDKEAVFWGQCAAFKRDVLSKPWVLDHSKAVEHGRQQKAAEHLELLDRQVKKAKWQRYEEKMRLKDEKDEQQRRKREVMYNAGALPGSDVLTMPWDTNR